MPRLDVDETARRLCELLVPSAPDESTPSSEPLFVATRQLFGGAEADEETGMAIRNQDHPQPCRLEVCRPCGLARAILVLYDHQVQTSPIFTSPGAPIQRPADLKILAERMTSADCALDALDEALGRYTELLAMFEGSPLDGADPERKITEGVRALRAASGPLRSILAWLPGLLLQNLRPEVRASGHRPPDSLLVDLVRDLVHAGFGRAEIVALIAQQGEKTAPGGKREDYWVDRVARAERKLATSSGDRAHEREATESHRSRDPGKEIGR